MPGGFPPTGPPRLVSAHGGGAAGSLPPSNRAEEPWHPPSLMVIRGSHSQSQLAGDDTPVVPGPEDRRTDGEAVLHAQTLQGTVGHKRLSPGCR